MESLVPMEVIEKRILLIRGRKVMLDADLAELYGVPTKALKQAVKRNIKRFPSDFMFILLGGSRYSPMAFTEQGVAYAFQCLEQR